MSENHKDLMEKGLESLEKQRKRGVPKIPSLRKRSSK
jgi:hypothetical protein